jgi:DNA-binding NarL/FixJ family response regulator
METILVSIVEDICDIRTGLEKIINEAPGFVCVSAYFNAEDALNDLPVLEPDIVIMDINLAGMSGIDCLRKVKAICPKMQFIMFTIYEDSEQIFEALSSGATGYLLKNTPHHEIPAAIKELFHGGAPMSAGIARKVVGYLQQKTPSMQDSIQLSSRENEILHLLGKGFLYKEIAQKLGIVTGTVRQHIHHIYEKLHVENRTEAINKVYGRQTKSRE